MAKIKDKELKCERESNEKEMEEVVSGGKFNFFV